MAMLWVFRQHALARSYAHGAGSKANCLFLHLPQLVYLLIAMARDPVVRVVAAPIRCPEDLRIGALRPGLAVLSRPTVSLCAWLSHYAGSFGTTASPHRTRKTMR